MRKILTVLLISMASIPTLACSDTIPQAQPAEESVSTSTITPAELLRNGKAPFEGVLTGGQPTPQQLRTLAELGYRTVINLRAVGEKGSTQPASVEALGMTYVSIPISGAADVSEANARKLAAALETHQQPAVVHCASGNRVGALFALKAYYVDGQTATESLAIGKAAGVTRLEPVIRQQLGLE